MNCAIAFFHTVGLFVVSPEDESCLLLKDSAAGFVLQRRLVQHCRYVYML